MRAKDFITESPLNDLENDFLRLKVINMTWTKKVKCITMPDRLLNRHTREQLTASDEMFDDGLNIEDEAQKGADWMGKRLQIETCLNCNQL